MAEKDDLYEDTKKLAYELHEQRGKLHGYDLDDWLDAERIMLERLAQEIGLKLERSSKKKDPAPE